MQWDLLLRRFEHQHCWFLCLWTHAPSLDLLRCYQRLRCHLRGRAVAVFSVSRWPCLICTVHGHTQEHTPHPRHFCICPDGIISLACGHLTWRPGMSHCNLCGSVSGQKKTQFFFSCVYCEGRNDKENKTEDGWSFLFHPIRSFFSLTLPCLLCAPHKDNIPISKKLYPLSKQVHKSKYLDGAVKSSIIENTEAQMVT